MLTLTLSVIIPLILANILHQAVVVKSNWCAFLAHPIDGGICLGGKRLFGSHKTWRGFIVVIVCTTLYSLLFGFCAGDSFTFMHDGIIASVGYMLGELPNSFLKRRLGIHEGASGRGLTGKIFAQLDHADSIVGASLMLYFFGAISYPPSILLTGAILGVLFHIAVTKILHHFHFR